MVRVSDSLLEVSNRNTSIFDWEFHIFAPKCSGIL
jgi:hypothetical protein